MLTLSSHSEELDTVLKQTKKLKLPIKAWLSFSFILFTIVLIVILWLIQTVFLEDIYKNIKIGQVKNCATAIAENIENDDITGIIYDVQEQNDMAISVYDVSSNVITRISSNDPSTTGIRSFLDMSDIYSFYTKAVNNGGDVLITEKEGYRGKIKPENLNPFKKRSDGFPPEGFKDFTDESTAGSQSETQSSESEDQTTESQDTGKNVTGSALNSLLYINGESFILSITDNEKSDSDNIPLERDSIECIAYGLIHETQETTYLIVVESEITPVTSVIDTLRIELIIVTAALILISIAVAIFTATRISKPIIRTNETAKLLANQNYDVIFDKTSYKEINELNSTLTLAAQELKNVDTLRRELIANVSHDLRTPLTMISGYAQVMQDIPGENTPENLQVIIDESNRLSLLVSDLMDISKLEAGEITLNKELFSLTLCIQNIFNRYTKLREQEQINIEFIHDGEVFVIADEIKITQVIYNLINNAINYIGEDKTVIVKQTVIKDKVRIDIIDHGEGIPEDKIQYIWDRYYKVDKEHKRAIIGTGLGLSIVKNILINHDAEYGVTSKYNEGSDFYFILPKVDLDENEDEFIKDE